VDGVGPTRNRRHERMEGWDLPLHLFNVELIQQKTSISELECLYAAIYSLPKL